MVAGLLISPSGCLFPNLRRPQLSAISPNAVHSGVTDEITAAQMNFLTGFHAALLACAGVAAVGILTALVRGPESKPAVRAISPARIPAECELNWETAFLEAQVDSALDGILVVDNHGQKILQNQRHRGLWKIPAHISENYTEQLKFFMKQTKHPDEFLKKVSYLYTHPDEVVRD